MLQNSKVTDSQNDQAQFGLLLFYELYRRLSLFADFAVLTIHIKIEKNLTPYLCNSH